jgi:hypothetical protein
MLDPAPLPVVDYDLRADEAVGMRPAPEVDQDELRSIEAAVAPVAGQPHAGIAEADHARKPVAVHAGEQARVVLPPPR